MRRSNQKHANGGDIEAVCPAKLICENEKFGAQYTKLGRLKVILDKDQYNIREELRTLHN
jgi:hypothetical protein